MACRAALGLGGCTVAIRGAAHGAREEVLLLNLMSINPRGFSAIVARGCHAGGFVGGSALDVARLFEL